MNNLAGIGDAYWYEWSVGLLYALDMLIDDNIKHVILQHNNMQGLDDVVIVYQDGSEDCIQVKHTRKKNTLTFLNLVSREKNENGKMAKQSLLSSFCKDWLNVKARGCKTCRAILFTNRKIGDRDSSTRATKTNPSYKLQALDGFWKWLTAEIKKVDEFSQIQAPTEWQHSWELWRAQMQCINDDAQKLEFLRNFDLRTSKKDLEEIVEGIGGKLSDYFKAKKRTVIQLDQKLCYALRDWTTTSRKKQEITKEDLFNALSLCADSIVGEHEFKVCEPFFNSRLDFTKMLEEKLLKRAAPVVLLTGDPGSGKTNIVTRKIYWRSGEKSLDMLIL